MEGLDRLVWTATMSFRLLGVRFGVRADHPELLARARERLPALASPLEGEEVDVLYSIIGGAAGRPGVRRYLLLYDGAARIARTMSGDELLDALSGAIRGALADRADEWLLLHAGVVGWRGRAILLPGGSFTGKTSLVVALLAAGATYYADDCAVIDGDGRVHPYAEPLGVRCDASARQMRTHPRALSAAAGELPLPVGLVALTRFRADAEWRGRPLSQAGALLAMLRHAPAVRARPMQTLQLLRRATAGARILAGTRGDASSAARAILRAAEGRAITAAGATRRPDAPPRDRRRKPHVPA